MLRAHRPFATDSDEGDDFPGSEAELLEWVKRCAELARSKDAASQCAAAVLLQETFADAPPTRTAKVQVAAVGVLLALVRNTTAPHACAAAIRALGELHAALVKARAPPRHTIIPHHSPSLSAPHRAQPY